MIFDIEDILNEWAADTIREIQSNLDSTGTTASGKTKESLEYILTDNGVKILGRQYFRGVEEGRPAGKVPYNFQDIIAQWMKDKGISAGTPTEDRSMAYLIAQKIKNEGTRLYRSNGREDIYTNVINEKLSELEQKLTVSVKDTILKSI